MTRVEAGARHDPLRRAWLAQAFSAALGAALMPAGLARAADAATSRFRIERASDGFVIEGTLTVDVPQAVAWAVLVDYDHMHEFVPNMRESRVLSRDGDTLRVLQRGFLPLGPFRFPYDVEREVWLEPESSVVSRGVRGNMRKVEMLTELDPVDDGVRILHRTVLVPDFWVPPIVGPRMLRARAEAQFDALVTEMRRRAGRPTP